MKCYTPFLRPLLTEMLNAVHPKQSKGKVKVLEPTCGEKEDAQSIGSQSLSESFLSSIKEEPNIT